MREIYLAQKAKACLANAGYIEIDSLKRTFWQLSSGEIQGLQLWGSSNIYTHETPSGKHVTYSKDNNRIVILSLSGMWAPLQSRVKFSAVILAAGKTSGAFELPLPNMVESLLRGGIDDLIVVLGSDSEYHKKVLSDKPVKVVVNSKCGQGLSRSIRYGLKTIAPDTGAVLVTLGNRPFITPGLVNDLIRNYKQEKSPILVPTFDYEKGHPVVFAPAMVPELMRLRGNTGGRALFKSHKTRLKHIEVNDRGVIACLGN